MNRVKANLVFVLCAIYSLIAGLYPFEFSGKTLHLNRELPWKVLTLLAVRLRDVGLDDFVTNVVYFLPWGALVYVCGSPRSRNFSTVLRAALVGGIVSFWIELSQIFFTKEPSIFDVLANTLGAVLGALFCALSPLGVRRLAARCLGWLDQSQLLLPAAVVLGAVPLLISVSKFPWFDLNVWNRHYTSQLGKKASMEFPWPGVVYLAGVYERALDPMEIGQNYDLSRSNDVMERPPNAGLVALCTFSEEHGDQPNDDSYCALPLSIALLPTSHFRWLHGRNGIDIVKPSVLTSERPAQKLFDAIRGRNELSVEFWMTRGAVADSAQDSDGADVASNTSRASNAQPVNLRSGNEFQAPEHVHLVVTYKGGVRKLFVNGREYSYSNFYLRLGDFIVSFGNNPVAQIAYSFVYFFPASFFLSRALSKRSLGYSNTLLVPITIAVSLLSLAELVQAYLFGRSVDLAFVSYGIVVVMAGALCGIFLGSDTRALEPDFLASSSIQPGKKA
ncbi:MAG TPA: VanZ family protein [Blastocatellia bacterium]|nr:VanZ family protein [Blastocatellia bacterium]